MNLRARDRACKICLALLEEGSYPVEALRIVRETWIDDNGKHSQMHDAIRAFLSSPAHHTCLLLAHSDIHTLEETAGELTRTYNWPRLSVGRELSAALLAESPARHNRTARRWLADALTQASPGPVLCSEIDVLFEPALDLDPLALFRRAGRTTQLVVLWPGTYQNEVLTYAVPEHHHYNTWRQPGVKIIGL